MKRTIWSIAVISIIIAALFGASMSSIQVANAQSENASNGVNSDNAATTTTQTWCLWPLTNIAGTMSIMVTNNNISKMVCQFENHPWAQQDRVLTFEGGNLPTYISAINKWTENCDAIINPSGHATLKCTVEN